MGCCSPGLICAQRRSNLGHNQESRLAIPIYHVKWEIGKPRIPSMVKLLSVVYFIVRMGPFLRTVGESGRGWNRTSTLKSGGGGRGFATNAERSGALGWTRTLLRVRILYVYCCVTLSASCGARDPGVGRPLATLPTRKPPAKGGIGISKQIGEIFGSRIGESAFVQASVSTLLACID